MPPIRTRLAVASVSLAIIGLELALMRELSVRYWHHFAYMVISVALLGFGASGTALVLLRKRVGGRERMALFAAAAAFAVSIPLALRVAAHIPLNLAFIAWDFSQIAWVLVMELVLVVPFFLGAAVIGLALMDRPERIGGHYAANLVGSGVGGIAAVALMNVVPTAGVEAAMTTAAALGAAAVAPWRRPGPAAAMVLAAAAAGAAWLAPHETPMSEYKLLPQLLKTPDIRVLGRHEGPLGRIDVVAGPATHYAPGLSLAFMDRVPRHALIIIDGDAATAVYDCPRRQDWRFLDYTTQAAPYHLRRRPRVLVIGAGGGSDLGLATYHRSPGVEGLEANRQIVDLMAGPLRGLGGRIVRHPDVDIRVAEARGYLGRSDETFDLVQLPSIEAFGASGAGLYAAQESYLYTVEAVEEMLARLSEDGVVCLTRWARTPPRDGLRLLDTAAQALRRGGADPRRHLAMIRSWVTVTVLAFRRPITPHDAEQLRAFCRERSFDLCHLPDLRPDEVNRYHVLPRPVYSEAARALLGPDRRAFLEAYLFDVEARTDDRPYFGHFLRWRSIGVLSRQLGRRARAHLELGYLMLVAALGQAVLLGAVLILAPLGVRAGGLRRARGRGAALAYFLLLGTGFMFLEMGFLQRLVLYLAHPVYAASAVIASFLVFAGLGSRLSQAWPGGPSRVAAVAGLAAAVMALGCLVGLDEWLALTRGHGMGVRFVVAAATIGPLAFAMGHMMPLGLRLAGRTSPGLVPWAWGVNGFASVVATVGTPVVAMSAGFSRVVVAAACCYAVAAWLAVRLGAGAARPQPRLADLPGQPTG